jgi:hypothetical protein
MAVAEERNSQSKYAKSSGQSSVTSIAQAEHMRGEEMQLAFDP